VTSPAVVTLMSSKYRLAIISEDTNTMALHWTDHYGVAKSAWPKSNGHLPCHPRHTVSLCA
jgi:hypothetical protein